MALLTYIVLSGTVGATLERSLLRFVHTSAHGEVHGLPVHPLRPGAVEDTDPESAEVPVAGDRGGFRQQGRGNPAGE